MTKFSGRGALTLLAATGLVAAPLTLANASSATPAALSAGQKIVARGLNGPSEIQFGPGGSLYIANRDTGAVVRSPATAARARSFSPRPATVASRRSTRRPSTP